MATTPQLIAEVPYTLTAPAFDAQGNLYAACSQSGAILRFDEASRSFGVAMETEGQPQAIAIDPSTNEFFFADAARQAVIKVEAQPDGTMAMTEFVQQFEGAPLLGPRSLCFTADREIVVADSGVLGDTSLTRPAACVYRTVQSRQQLVRLTGANLAFASSVAVSAGDGCIFVAEMAANRVLRYLPRAEGHYHGSVFAQLSGSMGPSSVAIHPTTRDVYIAQQDDDRVSREGVIRVFDAAGNEKGFIGVPGVAGLTGIAVAPSGTTLFIVAEQEGGKSKLLSSKLA